MSSKKEPLTMESVQQDMQCLRKVFSMVRLVKATQPEGRDTASTLGLSPCDDDSRESPCEFYASKGQRTVLTKKGTHLHFQIIDGKMYQIFVKPLTIEGVPYVLEMLKHIDNTDLFLAEGYDQLMSFSQQLYIDALTGAYNRRFWEDKMKSFSGIAGIALIDLDDLKLYNDTFGHSAGDAALKALVRITKKCIRRTDKLIRYGGDEFLLIMPNVSSSIFGEKLRSIKEHIREAEFPDFPGLKISASIGGTMLYNGSIEEVVSRADKLMYYAKSYKNTVAMDDEVEYEKQLLDAPAAKPQVLIIDDSELNRDLLKEMLRDRYEILEAADGEKGLALLYELGTKISLVLLDVVMPKVGGFDVLAVMQKERWLDDIPVMMISAEDSPAFIQKAYDMGASDYITRPFNMNVVRQRSNNITKLYAKQRRLLSLVTSQIQEKERNNHIIISILSEVVGLKNGESRKHILNVSRITELLLSRVMQRSSRYHLTWQDEALITNAAALHDIGKIGIDEKILNKPGKLTQEEFEIMKTHTLIGAKMIENLEGFQEEPLVKVTYAICRWHHERWDGRGYPDGLKGDAIPISAQIVSLADVYDALTSKRVYKDAFAHEKAIQMILDGECGLFNPLLLDCLLDIKDQLKEELQKNSTSLDILPKIPERIVKDL